MIIRNRNDMSLLTDDYVKKYSIPKTVILRMSEIEDVLDESYGVDRSSYGGELYLLCDNEESIVNILNRYGVDEECFEYEDYIAFDDYKKTCWVERMWVVGSDNAVIIIDNQKVR